MSEEDKLPKLQPMHEPTIDRLRSEKERATRAIIEALSRLRDAMLRLEGESEYSVIAGRAHDDVKAGYQALLNGLVKLPDPR